MRIKKNKKLTSLLPILYCRCISFGIKGKNTNTMYRNVRSKYCDPPPRIPLELPKNWRTSDPC